MEIKEIHSLQNPLVKHLYRLYRKRSYREECGTYCLEGKKLICDITPHIIFKTLLVEQGKELPPNLSAENLFFVPRSILEKITEMDTQEGYLAEAALPKLNDVLETPILALDALQDPGNLGTLMRTAVGFGFKTILFLPRCCDPFSPKVLRSSKGAHVHLKLCKDTLENILAKIPSITPFVATLQGTPFDTILPEKDILLILGNEGQGAQKAHIKMSREITIPMKNKLNSLNVAQAGAILMHYFRHG